jgi:hypothetical protein
LKRWAHYLTGSLMFASLGCSQPFDRPGTTEKAMDRDRSVITGDPFLHLIHRQGTWDSSSPVHVYLDGDGLPWITRTQIARDPTPRTPLALRLMAADPSPSLYIGRPCYHGLATSPGCSPWLWTHGRYSEEVVKSMAAALRHTLGTDSDREVTLIGYSGGGVLAMLIAARMEQVVAVVTIAANLDIATWADHHGYSRLLGSLNPATQPPLPARIRQIHLAGERDIRVPPYLSKPAVSHQPNAQFLVVPNFDHSCCWERVWPAILARLKQHDFTPGLEALQIPPATAETRP